MCGGGGAQAQAVAQNGAANAAILNDVQTTLNGGLQYGDAAVTAEADKLIAAGDPRFPTRDAYYQWHYDTMGKAEGRAAPVKTGGVVGDAATASSNLLTSQTADADARLVATDNALGAAVDATDTAQNNYVTQLASGFTDLTDSLRNQGNSLAATIAGMMESNKAQQSAMLSAMNKGPTLTQKQKRPNIYGMLLKNKQMAMQGLGGTNLTGPGGVSSGALSLGSGASLLGS